MAQITDGVRAILSNPNIYSALQSLMGAHRGRTTLTNDFIKPFPDMHILDIGCGPAEILDYLPAVKYWGFDISEAYIDQANNQYSKKGQFFCKELAADVVVDLPSFDVVLAIGLLHHLDDSAAKNLINLAKSALKSGGRLITVDPCFEEGQNPIAKYLISKDRGQNVRKLDGYASLIDGIFTESRVEVRHKKWIPYTHCFMECIRS